MNSPSPASSKGQDNGSLPLVTMWAAVLVVILALGAVFFPRSGGYDLQGVFLVFNTPNGSDEREELFASMSDYLNELSGHPMELVVVSTRQEFLDRARQGVDFALCPDGLALELDQGNYGLMVSGRRKLPSNLRPRGVLVSRREGELIAKPWQSHPQRTVFGDSLSLVAMGGMSPFADSLQCAFGPDPYDHSPVLHALRLGAFDFALVRQWDAKRFFESGLLDSAEWGITDRTVPVPDIVMLASTKIPLVDRLKWADSLALVGRSGDLAIDGPVEVLRHLDEIGLVGFNLLLEPDFEMVRRKFQGNWPPE